MNKEETKQAILVMQAFVDGKEIEVMQLKRLGRYYVTGHPTWDWSEYDYRIKPEPRVFYIAENIDGTFEDIQEGDIWPGGLVVTKHPEKYKKTIKLVEVLE